MTIEEKILKIKNLCNINNVFEEISLLGNSDIVLPSFLQLDRENINNIINSLHILQKVKTRIIKEKNKLIESVDNAWGKARILEQINEAYSGIESLKSKIQLSTNTVERKIKNFYQSEGDNFEIYDIKKAGLLLHTILPTSPVINTLNDLTIRLETKKQRECIVKLNLEKNMSIIHREKSKKKKLEKISNIKLQISQLDPLPIEVADIWQQLINIEFRLLKTGPQIKKKQEIVKDCLLLKNKCIEEKLNITMSNEDQSRIRTIISSIDGIIYSIDI